MWSSGAARQPLPKSLMQMIEATSCNTDDTTNTHFFSAKCVSVSIRLRRLYDCIEIQRDPNFQMLQFS